MFKFWSIKVSGYKCNHAMLPWRFYLHVDSPGNDCDRVVPAQSFDYYALHPAAVAVNTLGFVKHAVTLPLVTNAFINHGAHGIWIKDPPCIEPFEFMHTRAPERRKYMESYTVPDAAYFGIAKFCDWFVVTGQVVRLKDTRTPRVIFVGAFQVGALAFFIDHVLPLLNEPFTLVFTGADDTFPRGSGDTRSVTIRSMQPKIQYLMDHALFSHGFIENLDTVHPKLSPLPVGVLVHEAGEQATLRSILTQAQRMSLPRPNDRPHAVLVCHRNRDHPQFVLRHSITDRLSRGLWSDVAPSTMFHEVSHDDFISALTSHRFCVCVHGGGIDPSPKAWEAILCGCIPIVAHSALDAAYSQLPVVFVDDWSDDALTPTKLAEWQARLEPWFTDPDLRAEVLRKLSMAFWWDRIAAASPPDPGQI